MSGSALTLCDRPLTFSSITIAAPGFAHARLYSRPRGFGTQVGSDVGNQRLQLTIGECARESGHDCASCAFGRMQAIEHNVDQIGRALARHRSAQREFDATEGQGSSSIVAVGAMKRNMALRWLEKLELFLYSRAAAVVALTGAFKENLIRRGISSEKIAVVTNGVDLSRYKPRPIDHALGLPRGRAAPRAASAPGARG